MTDEEFLDWLQSDDNIRAILVEAYAQIDGVETLIRMSHVPYTSDDNHAYLAIVSGGVSFNEGLSLDGQATSGAGDIEIANPSGERDEWMDYIWVNRPIEVFMGDVRWNRADFRKVFSGVTKDIKFNGRTGLVLNLMNKLDKLNSPALETKFTTGPSKDKLIPYILGEPFNIEPSLEVANDLIYRFSLGPCERLIEVRDNGAPRSDVDDLSASGKFQITDNAVVGQITCSVQGENTGGYAGTVASAIKMLVKNLGPVEKRFTDADIDLDNFAAFEIECPQAIGLVIVDSTSVLAYAQQLAASVGAQVTASSLGKLRLVRMQAPTTGATEVVDESDMIIKSLIVEQRTEVQASHVLEYARNWTVQSSGMAEGLPADSATSFSTDVLEKTSKDTTVATTYKLSEEPEPIPTLLIDEDEALAEAERRLTMWKQTRMIVTGEYFQHMILKELGDKLIIQHPRYGLAAGKQGMIMHITRDWFKGRVTIGVLI